MIEKITDQNLERYDSRLKEWCDRKFFEKGNYGKYQTTEEANIVAFYPAPNTPLEGKIKFSFKETMPASGDKGPENPSTIAGIENIKVIKCGKNLLKFLNYSSNTINDVTCSADSDGIITLNGTASGNASFQQYFNPKIRLDNDTVAFCSYEIVSGTYTPPTGQQIAFIVQDIATKTGSNSVYLGVNNTNISGIQKTIPAGYAFAGSNVVAYSGASFDNLKLKVQLKFGNSRTSWESPVFFDYTSTFDSIYYGGEIDLVTGVMTVTYVICELNGTEWWNPLVYNSSTGYGWSYCIPRGITGYEPTLKINSIQDPSIVCCSHFITSPYGIGDMSINNGTMNYSAIFLAGSQCRFSFQYSDLADWKAYLAAQKTAGTPVKVAYLVDVPFTVQLTPAQILSLSQIDKYTPRLNTVYTDADSIQIFYLKSPIRDEYEKTQAILSLGGNS